MGIEKGKRFAQEDIYVDYPMEQVKFRWDHFERKVYRKFYDGQESAEAIPQENELFNEALRFGNEIKKDGYEAPGQVS